MRDIVPDVSPAIDFKNDIQMFPQRAGVRKGIGSHILKLCGGAVMNFPNCQHVVCQL